MKNNNKIVLGIMLRTLVSLLSIATLVMVSPGVAKTYGIGTYFVVAAVSGLIGHLLVESIKFDAVMLSRTRASQDE